MSVVANWKKFYIRSVINIRSVGNIAMQFERNARSVEPSSPVKSIARTNCYVIYLKLFAVRAARFLVIRYCSFTIINAFRMIKHSLDRADLGITLLCRLRLLLDSRISLNLHNKSNVTLGCVDQVCVCMTT